MCTRFDTSITHKTDMIYIYRVASIILDILFTNEIVIHLVDHRSRVVGSHVKRWQCPGLLFLCEREIKFSSNSDTNYEIQDFLFTVITDPSNIFCKPTNRRAALLCFVLLFFVHNELAGFSKPYPGCFPIARPLGRDMGCLLCISTLFYFPPHVIWTAL